MTRVALAAAFLQLDRTSLGAGGRPGVDDRRRAPRRDRLARSDRAASGPALGVDRRRAGNRESAVAGEALRRLQASGWFVFVASAADVNAGRTFVGQLEERVRELAEHAGGRSVVWVMPSFENALWSGQHTRSPRGLLDMLLPYVESGQLSIVGEIEPRAYELLVRQRPRVKTLFDELRLEPLTREEAIAVARDWGDRLGATVSDETIADAHELAQHYLASVGAPAGLLRLLKAAQAEASLDGEQEIGREHLLRTLSKATGLPLHVVDTEAPLDLDDVRLFFSERIIGQPEAVECLVERIALIKASLTDPTRPLGVFLFVGPTGTGKTEIAKTLAEFLFGSPDRLVRLDMSEFQTENSFERLLADASSSPEAATLISSVRANPFSVVLLDEFEKAHRNVWSLFLQLFDDARLTDQQGQTADFRQCVVVLTSNYGSAVASRAALGFGGGGPLFDAAAVERGLSGVFRPEFLNRLDRIVVFRPFERDQIRALLERELALVLERRGFRSRPWVVEWDESALAFLEEQGFSPQLGARPLKRAIERHLLAPLAEAIVSRSFPEGEQFLFISAHGDGIDVTFVDPDAAEDESSSSPTLLPEPDGLRLDTLALGRRGGAEEAAFLQEELERLRAIIAGEGWGGRKELDLATMRGDGFWEAPDRFDVLTRIEYVDRVQAALQTAEKLASRLTRLGQTGRGRAGELVELLARRLYLLDRATSADDALAPADAFLQLGTTRAGPAEAEFELRLRDMYEAWAQRRGMRVRRLELDGYVVAITGIAAYQILASEAGVHVFELPRDERAFRRTAISVTVAPAPAAPPEAELVALARSALSAAPALGAVVRRYRMKPSPLVRDSVRGWRTGRLDLVLGGDFDLMEGQA